MRTSISQAVRKPRNPRLDKTWAAAMTQALPAGEPLGWCQFSTGTKERRKPRAPRCRLRCLLANQGEGPKTADLSEGWRGHSVLFALLAWFTTSDFCYNSSSFGALPRTNEWPQRAASPTSFPPTRIQRLWLGKASSNRAQSLNLPTRGPPTSSLR